MLLLLQTSVMDDKNLPLIGMLVLAVAYLIIRPRLRRKDPLERSSAPHGLAQQRSVERTMQNLLVDLTEMARQVSSQLDTRAAKLEALIREADLKIEQLRSSGSSTPPIDPPAHMRLVSGESAESGPTSVDGEQIDARHAKIYAMADEGRAAKEIAARLNRPSGEVELILALRSHG